MIFKGRRFLRLFSSTAPLLCSRFPSETIALGTRDNAVQTSRQAAVGTVPAWQEARDWTIGVALSAGACCVRELLVPSHRCFRHRSPVLRNARFRKVFDLRSGDLVAQAQIMLQGRAWDPPTRCKTI